MKNLIYLSVLIAFALVGCEKENFDPIQPETFESDSTDLGTYYSDTATYQDTVTVVVYDTNSNVDWGSLPNFAHTFESNKMYDYNVDSLVYGNYSVELTKDIVTITIDGITYESMADVEFYNESYGLIKGKMWNDAGTISGTFLYQMDEYFEFEMNHEGTELNAFLFGY